MPTKQTRILAKRYGFAPPTSSRLPRNLILTKAQCNKNKIKATARHARLSMEKRVAIQRYITKYMNKCDNIVIGMRIVYVKTEEEEEVPMPRLKLMDSRRKHYGTYMGFVSKDPTILQLIEDDYSDQERQNRERSEMYEKVMRDLGSDSDSDDEELPLRSKRYYGPCVTAVHAHVM